MSLVLLPYNLGWACYIPTSDGTAVPCMLKSTDQTKIERVFSASKPIDTRANLMYVDSVGDQRHEMIVFQLAIYALIVCIIVLLTNGW